MSKKVSLSLIITLTLISIIIYALQYNHKKESIQNIYLNNAKQQSKDIDKKFNDFIFKYNKKLHSVIENKNFIKFITTNKNNPKELFLTLIKSLPTVSQIRYIDKNGDEIIRVDNENNKRFIVSKKNLQNKKNRYYFKEISSLNTIKMWYSKIDLNMEHGKIIEPIEPTLRFALPIIVKNIKYGFIIFNANVQNFLNSLVKSNIYDINILDKDGEIIVSGNKALSWSRYLHKTSIFKNKMNIDDFYTQKLSFLNDDHLIVKVKVKPSYYEKQVSLDTQNYFVYFVFAIFSILLIAYILYIINHSKMMDLEKDKLNKILNTQNSQVILTDGKEIKDCNKSFLDFFGYENSSDFSKEHDCVCDFFEKDITNTYLQKDMNGIIWSEYLVKNQHKINKVKIRNTKGQLHIFNIFADIYNITSSTTGFIITFSDITELENANEKLALNILKEKDKANRDFLTGSYNRRYFFDSGEQLFKKAVRNKENIAVAMLDIDKFKNINDTYGHDVGDIAIKEVARILNDNLRDYDLVARFGGEEFCILLENISIQKTQQLFENIRIAFENNIFEVNKDKISYKVSIGICYGIEKDLDTMVKKSDEGLYYCKNNGRNQIAINK